MKRGLCSPVFSVHCGGCNAHFTPQNGAQGAASTCGTAAKRIGWTYSRAFGWLCPLCEADTTGVINGTAAHIRPKIVDDAVSQLRKQLIDQMAKAIRIWINDNPSKDPFTHPDVDRLCERIAPGFSGGMFEAAVRRAKEPE